MYISFHKPDHVSTSNHTPRCAAYGDHYIGVAPRPKTQTVCPGGVSELLRTSAFDMFPDAKKEGRKL